jgi:excisionase family DNA binding protein
MAEVPADPVPVFFTVAQAAAVLQCSKQSVYAQIRSGALRSAKVGRLRRISRIELDRFLRSVTDTDVVAWCERTTRASGVPILVEDPLIAEQVAAVLGRGGANAAAS